MSPGLVWGFDSYDADTTRRFAACLGIGVKWVTCRSALRCSNSSGIAALLARADEIGSSLLDCRIAKRFLERHGIPYTEVNIEATPDAAEEVIRRTGKRAIPQFVINGEWVQPYRPGEGFLYEEMSELLGISQSS
jgi:mycoredoxin